MRKHRLLIALLLVLMTWWGCASGTGETNIEPNDNSWLKSIPLDDGSLAVATFAGGCFWSIESGFEKINGVVEAVSGYTGGTEVNPTYKDVSWGKTTHLEAVQVFYKPEILDYATLLESYWKQIDPTNNTGQYVDRGDHYRTAIFYHDQEQKKMAQESLKMVMESEIFDKAIVTEIRAFEVFYDAEEYHQDFYLKEPDRYCTYRDNSGRKEFYDANWKNIDLMLTDKFQEKEIMENEDGGEEPMNETNNDDNKVYMNYQKPADALICDQISDLQYQVTQKNGTERPFQNEFYNNKRPGIYVDILSGEPLFSSRDKFDSGTGWPSFIRPLEKTNVVEKTDSSYGLTRIEVRSRYGDNHLGHVFDDGPDPTGLRYCINSASLRFIPKEEMVDQGYGDYLDQL